ncbi:MAG: radical SAM protein [Clostridiales bacterium]|jgi:sulfatase maturation enzyme AslB (radical SAM superfamily)|nr:radical SAM protein [Clostridiales bacterium]
MSDSNYNVYVNRGFTADEYDNISKYEENIASPSYKEYRKKWLEYPKKQILGKGPIHIDIDPTNFCNLRCKMCPITVIKKEKKEKTHIMDFDLYKKIIDEAADLGVPSVKFGILTESLVHPKIVEMVEYANAKNFEDIGIVTNATLLTEELARRLIKAGLKKINISFDSPVKETYEAIRIGADFDKTVNNIKRLIEIRNEMGSQTPLLRVTMVKMKENEEERQLFKDLFEPYADRIAFLDYEEYDEALAAKNNTIESKAFENFACAELWQRLVFDCHGMVTPCCSGTIYRDFTWDFKELGMAAIWSEKVQCLRQAFLNNNWKTIPMCKKCINRVADVSAVKEGKV